MTRDRYFTNVFQTRLALLRKAKGLTQEELAEKAGITQVYLDHLEKGRRTPCLENAVKIIRGLDGSAEWLLGLK